jgi:putative ABC transport system permease protein
MMRVLIHGIKSLVRRPAKTGMLFVILFVVFNLIFTGFIIQNSIEKSKDYIRAQIGSAVEYRMDYASLDANDKGDNQAVTSVPALSIQVAEKMAQNQYVTNYYITEAANVNSSVITPAQSQSSGPGFERDFSDFNLSGSNLAENINFVLGNVKLTAGRILSADDLKNGSNVVIISEDVATANSLIVGDLIGLSQVTQQQPGKGGGQEGKTTTTATAIDYEIIGVYQAVEDGFNVNTMFTSNTVVYNLKGTAAADETTGSIVFMLDSPEHVDTFKQEASPYLTSEYHILYSNDSEYIALTKPLNLISFITSILIWVVFIAGAAIIMALVTIFVRDRKFEIGLLLSSGEGRLKIISQFVFEMLVIAILAFTISVVSSSATSKAVSSWIVDNQLLSQTSLIGSTSTATAENEFRNFGQRTVTLYGAVNMQNVADKFDVSVDAAVIGKLMFASIVLILFGSSIPLVIIMGYRPRRIMQDDN